jgi:hypothetical protein
MYFEDGLGQKVEGGIKTTISGMMCWTFLELVAVGII